MESEVKHIFEESDTLCYLSEHFTLERYRAMILNVLFEPNVNTLKSEQIKQKIKY